MADYWHSRYLQALQKLQEAKSSEVRVAYIDLAAHYEAMERLCEHSRSVCEFRSAA